MAGGDGAGVRALLVEDYAMAAAALRAVLTADGGEVVATVTRAAELEPTATRLERTARRPDVAVTDLELPDARGVEVVRRLAAIRDRWWPQLRIVVHSRSDAPATVLAALRLGAASFVSKRDEVDLATVVRRVARGGTDLSPRVAGYLLGERPMLTARQQEVLQLVAEGYTNAEIAAAVGVGERTVEYHLAGARSVLAVDASPGSSARVKLATWWLGHGRG